MFQKQVKLQCIKCADLASDSGNSQQDQNDVAALLIGTTPDDNVFTICDDPATAEAEFNATIQGSPVADEERITDAFKLCLENAPAFDPTPPGLAQLKYLHYRVIP